MKKERTTYTDGNEKRAKPMDMKYDRNIWLVDHTILASRTPIKMQTAISGVIDTSEVKTVRVQMVMSINTDRSNDEIFYPDQ